MSYGWAIEPTATLCKKQHN